MIVPLHKTTKMSPDQLEATLTIHAQAGWECINVTPAKLVSHGQMGGIENISVTEYLVIFRKR